MTPLSFISPEENPTDLEKLLETGDLPKKKIPVKLVEDKAIVFNNIHGSILYGYGRYFGNPVGIRKPKTHIFDRPLELSLFETLYLLENKVIFVYSESKEMPWTNDQLANHAEKHYPRFQMKYLVFKDLRDKKYVPRPGQKFGADFIVYKKGPGQEHSSFCIRVLSGNEAKISSLDVVTSVRLATSVKKKYILANPITKRYFSFKWFKP